MNCSTLETWEYAIINSMNKFVLVGDEGFVYYTSLSSNCLMTKEKALKLKNRLDKDWKNKNFEGNIFYLNPDNDDQYDEHLNIVKIKLSAQIEEN